MTRTEFLLARIAEDDAVAREATPGPWWNESGTVHAPYPFGRDLTAGNGGACHPLDAQGGNGRDADADAEHASRHDPARVLAECESKRRIVEEYVGEEWVISQGHVTDWTQGAQAARETALRFLASVYAAHDDYDPAWAI